MTITRKQLSEAPTRQLRFATGQAIQLAEGDKRHLTGIHLAKIGDYAHPNYGDFSITADTTRELISNFAGGVYGQKIFVDVAHNPNNGAAAEITSLYMDGDWLKGDLVLTDYGVDSITQKKFIYLSIDYADQWQNTETKELHGAVLFGAGLTTRPFIKNQPGIQLAEITHGKPKAMNHLAELTKYLKSIQAGAGLTKSLSEQFEAKLTHPDTKDEDRDGLLVSYKLAADEAHKQLSEAGTPEAPVSLNITLSEGGSTGLTAAEVTKMLSDAKAADAATAAASTKKLSDNKARFVSAIEAAEGLGDETKKTLSAMSENISGEMPDAMIDNISAQQIKLGNQMEAAKQLSSLGLNVGGNPRITVGDDQSVDKMQLSIDKKLGLSDMTDAKRYENTGGQLNPENKKLAESVLAVFDQNNQQQLRQEAKLLGDAGNTTADIDVPAVFERTVLRESLYRLIGLQFVNSGVAPFNPTWNVPYSYRNNLAAGMNDTRVREGQGIQRAGIKQTSENTYPIPQKLAFEVSDELRYMTQASIHNLEAVAENQRNATRIIGEDTDRLIFNEQVQASDEYQPAAVVAEDLALSIASVAGAQVALLTGGVPGANDPVAVVRPRTTYDLKGNQVGLTENPIVMTYNGAVIEEYDPLAVDALGVTTLVPGDYYVLDYDIGEAHIVDENGAIQNPAGNAWTMDYSKSTNLAFFDIDVPTGTTEGKHWDGFLKLYGLRKTLLEDYRYHMVNYGLMSGNSMTQIECADKFEQHHRVPATELSTNGNLGRIKDVPNFKTSAPGMWMSDRRVMIGEQNQTRFRVAKPWNLNQLENQRDATGRFTGVKEAYGDQFLFLHTPKQLKASLTSIVLYSASSRIARAAV